jgi:hypothetical protein
MKKVFAFLIPILSCLMVMGQPPEGSAKTGMTFGAKTSSEGAVDVNNLASQISDGKEADIKVRGKVVEVCTEMGCWLKMETKNGRMMVKMKDHAFFVPLDLNGKEIVVDASAKMTVTPVEELKHYAKDAGKSKAEIAAIKEPKKEIILNAKGVLVL